jgi:hypothetical protein
MKKLSVFRISDKRLCTCISMCGLKSVIFSMRIVYFLGYQLFEAEGHLNNI